MKKAKIFLVSLSILAVVGGTLAFKAVRIPSSFYCTSPLKPNICDAQVNVLSTITTNPSAPLFACSTISNQTGVCPSSRFTPAE